MKNNDEYFFKFAIFSDEFNNSRSIVIKLTQNADEKVIIDRQTVMGNTEKEKRRQHLV